MESSAVVLRNQNPNEKEESRVSTALDNVAVFPIPAQEEPQEDQRKKDNDGLHKRRGIWHFKIREGGRWKEISTGTRNYQEARKFRTKVLQEQQEGKLPSDMAQWTLAKAGDRWLEKPEAHS